MWCDHGGLRASRRKPPPIKVAGRAWLENRLLDKAGGHEAPTAPPRHSRQTDCQPDHARWCRLASA
ncbi:hypothetical protein HMPREF0496_1512, partial [Lentilactobacillus hilgardii ATCC 27305]